MATSGTTAFTATRNQIIRQAALEVSAIGAGEIMGAEVANDFAFKLNAMVKHWQGRGLKIWTVTEGTLFPQPHQARYAVGTGGSDHVASAVQRAQLTEDAVIGTSTLRVETTANISVGATLGVLSASGFWHWSTVTGKTATDVTLSQPMSTAVLAGSPVFTYQSRIAKPIRVVAARRYDIDSGAETPIEVVSQQEYRDLPTKNSHGTINQLQYEVQLSAGYFNIWPVPFAVTELVNFTFWRPIETFQAGGDNPDLPEEWVNCLIWNLAQEMMGRYPVAPDRRRMIASRAETTLFDMEGFSREAESLFIQPAFGR